MVAVGNWVLESTSTVGTGIITLDGPAVGFASFASAIPAGDVWYSIEDANGNREAGIGSFDGNEILVRTTVKCTLVGNTYNDVNPTAISLSGNATVACTFSVDAYEELLAHISNTSNPHQVSTDDLVYNPAGDPITSSTSIQVAIVSHGVAIQETIDDLADATATLQGQIDDLILDNGFQMIEEYFEYADFVTSGSDTVLTSNTTALVETLNNLDVYVSGVIQRFGTDFTITAPSTITLLNKILGANDYVLVKLGVPVTPDLDLRGNLAASDGSDLVGFIADGAGAVARTLQDKGRDLVSRDDYASDSDFTAAGTAATAKLSQIDFYSEANPDYQILPSERGLVVRTVDTDERATFNAVPNGTKVGTNEAQSVIRVWGQDIIGDPSGSRQSLGMESHTDSDGLIRTRLVTRSEGTPALPHPDVYFQINGSNAVYFGRKKDGTTGRTNIGLFPRGYGFVSTLVTTKWSAGETVIIGDTRYLDKSDFLYLECTTGGTTGGSEPTPGQVGASVTDNTVTWVVKSKLYLAGSTEATAAIPAIYMDENGNTGFGIFNPSASYEFGSLTQFDAGLRLKNSGTNGTTLKNIYSTTITTNFTGSVAANSLSAAVTATLTGVAVGDSVALGMPINSVINGIVITAYISATNTVALKAMNITAAPIAMTSETYRLTVFQF